MESDAVEFSLQENPNQNYRITDPRFGNHINKFVLPDGRVFQVTIWWKSRGKATKPFSVVPVQHNYQGLSPAEIAKQMHYCVVAEAI